MKKILFIIYLDKFTKGLYEFMESNFPQYYKRYIFWGNKFERFDADISRCTYIKSSREIDRCVRTYNYAQECDAIIFSGIFGAEKLIILYGFHVFNKTYAQLWGQDFYGFREWNNISLKNKLVLLYRYFFIKNVRGIINLIPSDYSALRKLCSPRGKRFVAPVCDNGDNKILIEKYRKRRKDDDPVLILLGNSATETNQHIDALQQLVRYKRHNIRVLCPLSYGDKEYAKKVSCIGKELFEDKFIPIEEYMSLEKYIELLSRIHVAVFNNNRQQAMGNINLAMALGCKVYIRTDTSMWTTYFIERAFRVFDISTIEDLDYYDFIKFEIDYQRDNYEKYNRHYSVQACKEAWEDVLNSI